MPGHLSSLLWALAATAMGAVPSAADLPPGFVTVKSCGAVGDGSADDTAAFQRALDQAATTGGTVLVDPVEPGRGYVITRTVRVRQGTSLIGAVTGMPFIAWEGVPRAIQTGPVILARPAPDQYTGERKQPLFQLEGGCTIRGLYILYDQQPWPSDAEFDDPASPYHYETLEDLCARFIPEHVAPLGPTLAVSPGVASTTIEDITCGRYRDFCYMPAGGKVFVERCYLFGYGRALAVRESRDTIRIRGIHIVPNVEGPISWQHAKLQAAITAQPGNIAFDFGSVDGYTVEDVVVFLAHTGMKIGATEARPFVDPVTGEQVAFRWGNAPWGSVHAMKLDNVVVGFHLCNGTILPNQLSNIMCHQSIAPTETFASTEGPLGAQAAVWVEPEFAGGVLQVSNLALSSFAPRNVVATGQMVQQANGRAFLMDCPAGLPPQDFADRTSAHIEISGLVVSNIPDAQLFAASEGTVSTVRYRGFVHNGVAREDGELGQP